MVRLKYSSGLAASTLVRFICRFVTLGMVISVPISVAATEISLNTYAKTSIASALFIFSAAITILAFSKATV